MGAIDTNTGIYVYDEADSQATFSGLLNLGQNNTKTAVANLQALIASQSATARNYCYNANAAIAQRGTSFTATGWTFDRWHATITATTVSRVAIAATETLFGSEYAFTHTASSTTNSCATRQGFTSDDVAQMRGRTMVFSMPVRASASGVSVTIAVEKSATANAQISGTWTTINSVTVTPGTSGLIASVTAAIPQDATANGIRISVTTTNIANGASITYGDVIFERGTARSFFRLRNLTGTSEKSDCLAFYVADATTQKGWLGNNSSGNHYLMVRFPVPMRSVPNVAASSASGIENTSIFGCQLYYVGSTTADYAFNGYTANAELA